jgi:predicted CXXCH cytochrome family protein
MFEKMKKSIFAIAIALVVLAALATVVMADNGPHGSFSSTTDACASCHRAHSASFGGNALLINNPEAVCLECHNGEGAGTNVLYGVWNQGLNGDASTTSTFGGSDSYYGGTGATVQGTDGGSLLAGGFNFTRMATAWSGANFYTGGSAPASRATTSHHTYDGTAGTVWGSGASDSDTIVSGNYSYGAQYNLECISCHSPHGNAGYIQGATYPGTFSAVNGQTPDGTAAASYRLLRWQPLGSDGFTVQGTNLNWSGGAFKANGATGAAAATGWLVPDNYRANNASEWYTIQSKLDVGSQMVGFAPGDYSAGNTADVYKIVDEGTTTTTKKDYTAAAINVAFFCAQCHDRYFANSRLRNDTDASIYCGAPVAGTVSNGILLTVYAPLANDVHPVDAAGCEPVYNTSNVLIGWGDTRASGDTVYQFKHSSGDIRLSMDGTSAAGAGTSISRSCVGCHVAHGTSAQMTAFASGATFATQAGGNNSALLRLDNRALCLRCHASTVGFVVTPNPGATSTGIANLTATPGSYATQTAAAITATPKAALTQTQAAVNLTSTAAVVLGNATATTVAAQATSVCATALAGSLPCP